MSLTTRFASAQDYTISPSSVLTESVETGKSVDMQIDFNNTADTTLTIDWVELSNSFHANWQVVMCDYGNCWPQVPSSGTMIDIPKGGKGFIKLTISPQTHIWNGECSFKIVQPGFDPDTVTFNVSSIVGIEDWQLEEKVSIYPNPSTDYVALEALEGALENGSVEITDIRGAVMLSQQVASQSEIRMDVTGLPEGFYIFRYSTENGTVAKKILKTN